MVGFCIYLYKYWRELEVMFSHNYWLDNYVDDCLVVTHYRQRSLALRLYENNLFVADYHPWLFSPEVDIMPALLLPLAGPEEFDEDDMERLPTELQYLEPSKTREPDPLIRKNLIEALTQVLIV